MRLDMKKTSKIRVKSGELRVKITHSCGVKVISTLHSLLSTLRSHQDDAVLAGDHLADLIGGLTGGGQDLQGLLGLVGRQGQHHADAMLKVLYMSRSGMFPVFWIRSKMGRRGKESRWIWR